MTLRRISLAQARLLILAVEVDIPRRINEWTEQLAQGQLTDEMRDVFEAFGYLDKETRRQRKPRVTMPTLATADEIEDAVAKAASNGVDGA